MRCFPVAKFVHKQFWFQIHKVIVAYLNEHVQELKNQREDKVEPPYYSMISIHTYIGVKVHFRTYLNTVNTCVHYFSTSGTMAMVVHTRSRYYKQSTYGIANRNHTYAHLPPDHNKTAYVHVCPPAIYTCTHPQTTLLLFTVFFPYLVPWVTISWIPLTLEGCSLNGAA